MNAAKEAMGGEGESFDNELMKLRVKVANAQENQGTPNAKEEEKAKMKTMLGLDFKD